MYEVTRTITTTECDWLDADVPAGTLVWECRTATYGCISPGGKAVCLVPGGSFIELPLDAIKYL